MALILHILRQRNRVDNILRRLFRDRNNPLDYLSDEYIVKNYRLDRESIYRHSIWQDLEQDLLRFTNRSHSTPVSLQVMIALRYYASGSYLSVIGDAHVLIRCRRCISHNLSNYVQFPMSAEVQQRKVITKLPNSEQSYKGKVKTHNYINRQNQSTTGKL